MAIATSMLLATALTAAGAEEQPVTLSFHPAAGQVYLQCESISLTERMQFESGPPGTGGLPGLQGPLTIKIRLGVMTRLDVRGTGEDGSIDLGVTFVSIMSDGSIFGISSASPLDTSDPLALSAGPEASLATLIGDGYTMRVGSSGRLVKVSGFDEMVERIAARLGLDDAEREEMRKELSGGVTSGDYFPSGNVADLYPAAPVRVGDSWATLGSTSVNGMLLMTENTYTLVARRQGVAVVELRSVMTSHRAEVRAAALTGEPEVVVKGRQGGVIEIDEASGWVLKVDLEQELTGTIMVPAPDSEEMTAVGFSLRGSYKLVSTSHQAPGPPGPR